MYLLAIINLYAYNSNQLAKIVLKYYSILMQEIPLDTAMAVERLLLWDDVKNIFQKYAFTLGIQETYDYEARTVLTLGQKFDDNYDIELWGVWNPNEGINEATIIYRFRPTDEDRFLYELLPSSITKLRNDTSLTNLNFIQDLRATLGETEWCPDMSSRLASEKLFFS